MKIALDGPSGAGKSTVAKALAKRLGIIYVDTGALYRTIGLYVRNKGIDKTDTSAVIACLDEIQLDMQFINGEQIITLNGEKIGQEIRTGEIAMYASAVSAIPQVRTFLLETQRKIARENDVVMDGRDIGTVILPDAEVKIFMVASPEARAKRRYLELTEKGESCTYESVLADIIERDTNDSTRKVAPAIPAQDAVHLDNSDLTIEQTVDAVIKIIEEKTQKKKTKRIRGLYRFIKYGFSWFFYIVYGLKIRGREKEPQNKNFVICANHTSLMDVVPLVIALNKNQIRFMAKKEIFKIPILRGFARGMGGYPVDRKGGDVSAIKKTIEILKEEHGCVGIFPQGTRQAYKDPRQTPIKDGVGMVAIKAGVGILPIAIKTKKGKLSFFRRAEIIIGDYIDPTTLNLEGTPKEQYKELTHYAFDKVCNMLEEKETPKEEKND